MLGRERLYESALRGGRPLLRLAAPFHRKLGRGVRGRRRAVAVLEAWAGVARASDRSLVWVHAPSVGEGLMAQAIVTEVRARRPDLQIAFTYFSPSAERIAAKVGADVHGYLPWDVRGEVVRANAALRPAVIAFVRTEIWPVLSAEARARGVRLALTNAVLSAESSRLRRASRFLLGPAYGRLDAVGAVARDDADRFRQLGVPMERVRVTGDARFDQVWERVQRLGHVPAATGSSVAPTVAGGHSAAEPEPGRSGWLDRFRDAGVTTLVAGSTWPADEAVLIPAFARAAASARFRLIIAPHEPDPEHLSGVEERLSSAGVSHTQLAELEAGAGDLPQAVVVDRLGVLADLYSVGEIAYIGGGFHSAGLHSVVEPAALALPVVFGPRHANAREAGELADAGGGWIVADTAALASRLVGLAQDPGERRRAGASAVDFVRSRLGGAARNAELIVELLD